jgi:hypothetical protein
LRRPPLPAARSLGDTRHKAGLEPELYLPVSGFGQFDLGPILREEWYEQLRLSGEHQDVFFLKLCSRNPFEHIKHDSLAFTVVYFEPPVPPRQCLGKFSNLEVLPITQRLLDLDEPLGLSRAP